MSNNIVEKLGRLCERGRFVGLRRRFQGDPQHFGFILRVEVELILMHQFHDFCSEGLTVLRIEDIESVTSGKSEQLSNEIIRNERISTAFDTSYDLNNMHMLLESLRKKKGICIVECESEVWSEDDEFSIGRVVSVERGILKMACFDPLGIWGQAPEEIEINAVTKCQMETPYINAFSRYLNSKLGRKPGREQG
jgi:hypothetical protein